MTKTRLPRRRFLHVAASAVVLPAIARYAWAQTYPARPVRVIVPFAPGGGTDIVARLVAQWLTERLGQQFIIENRTGGAGNIGVETVVRAPADGYTLLVTGSSPVINANLYEKLNFDFARDVAPVATIVRAAQVMQVNPLHPATTVPGFITYARNNSGKMSMGSGGNGSGAHLAGEMFQMMTGVRLVHVPYRGAGPAVADLLGGQIEVTFTDMPTSIGYIRAGKLRALAVTTEMRSDALPDVPTVAETLPGFEASQWVGLTAPKGTPSKIVGKLNAEVNAGLADPKLKARFIDLALTVIPASPADFGKIIVEDIEKWGKVIRAANIRPE